MKNDIEYVIGSFLESEDTGPLKVSIPNASTALKTGSYDEFYFSLVRPLSRMVDNIITRDLPNHPDAQFLFKHSRYVESHFETVIRKFEGPTCSSDKAGTILSKLLIFFKNRKEISFDYEQDYTFHLPKKVFTAHAEILDFFNAIHSLHYGDHDQFVMVLRELYQRHGEGLEAVGR